MPESTKIFYMDYASSALSDSANPGAIHELGVLEKNKLETARAKIARILNAADNEIIFTSGATESNNLAILGLISSYPGMPHIVTTNIEHASVLEVCRHLEKTKKAKVTYVQSEPNGVVDPRKIKKALTKNTILVSVMYANNEIGTIQPIREIAKDIRHYKKTRTSNLEPRTYPIFHTDATQAINYLPINVAQLGVDMLSLNGAKIYGPKGVGVLYVKKNTPITPIMFGGGQEKGLRPGTENVAGALALARALETTEKLKKKEVVRLTKLRDYFIHQLQHSNIINNVIISFNGDLKNRLPNNINITIPNIPSDLLVIELSARGIMAAAKSACKAGDGKASHVIQAIRQAPLARTVLANGAETDGSLRFSLGRGTTKKDIGYTIKALSQILTKLEKWYN